MHTRTNQDYRFSKPMTEHQILEKAAEIVATKFISSEGDAFTNVGNTKDFLSFKLTVTHSSLNSCNDLIIVPDESKAKDPPSNISWSFPAMQLQ